MSTTSSGSESPRPTATTNGTKAAQRMMRPVPSRRRPSAATHTAAHMAAMPPKTGPARAVEGTDAAAAAAHAARKAVAHVSTPTPSSADETSSRIALRSQGPARATPATRLSMAMVQQRAGGEDSRPPAGQGARRPRRRWRRRRRDGVC
ncbi:hypothetical protein ACP70R_030451 [Stipagrostis hirtigluma subsp. patula]